MPESESCIRPAVSEYVTSPQQAVKLRMDSSTYGSIAPITIPDFFDQTVEQFPDSPALSFKDSDGEHQTVTYRQYRDNVCHVAKAFIKLGLQPNDIVSILAFNCPEWFYSEFGAIYAGGISAGIYTTNSPEAIHYILTTSQSKILIVDDDKQMKKIREIWPQLADLKTVVQINGPFEEDLGVAEGYYKWSDLEAMDTSDLNEELQTRLNGIAVNQCCALIFTSGTVGFPKAAMISHDNITWDARMVVDRFENVTPGHESAVTYLPISHIAAQMTDIFLPICMGGCVYFADRDALKGSLVRTLNQVRPTRFIGVPRVYEKFYEQLIQMESQLSTVKKALLNWARGAALQHHTNVKDSESLQFKLAKYLVLNKIKRSLGLDEVRTAMAGGAAVSTDIKKFFLSLNIPLSEVYGMSETLGHCLVDRNATNIETSGRPFAGISTKIMNPDENGTGEICLKGRNVFMGYMNNPEKNQEAFDESGWLLTGDLGTIDEKGYVYITGRLKELIVTAGGENIPPVHVEELIKKELPILSNAVLIGDKKKFLTVLLTFKVEIDPDSGIPSDRLLPCVKEWLLTLNLSYETVTEVIEAGPCPVVWKALEEGVARANKHAISNAQKVQKFAILPQDMSVPTGELGPTLKLKRNFVLSKYNDVIESLYV